MAPDTEKRVPVNHSRLVTVILPSLFFYLLFSTKDVLDSYQIDESFLHVVSATNDIKENTSKAEQALPPFANLSENSINVSLNKGQVRELFLSPGTEIDSRLFFKEKALKSVALRRRGDPALNYMKRKEALLDQGFTVGLQRFGSWNECQLQLRRNASRYRKVDHFLCLSKSYCFDDNLYISSERRGVRTDRILGQLEIWSNKKGLCRSFRSMLKPWTTEGLKWMKTFTFECWVVPADNNELEEKLSDKEYFKAPGWVFKPDTGGGGSGIYGVMDKNKVINDINWWKKRKKTYVIQPMLTNPLLIKNRKFDLRTHVLVTSVSPMRIFVHSNGIVRFASQDFKANYTKSSRTAFLTNLSVGGKVAKTEDLSWSFEEFKHFLNEKADEVFNRIDVAIARALVATEGKFKEKYTRIGNGTFGCRTCYQQIGIDILLDADLRPYIMEINGNPMQNFKSKKVTDLCIQFQHDITKLLYGGVHGDIGRELVKDLEALVPASETFDSFYSWLSMDHIEYLLRMKAELDNMNGFRVAYPPSDTKLSAGETMDWASFLQHLEAPPERIKFHNLLMALK